MTQRHAQTSACAAHLPLECWDQLEAVLPTLLVSRVWIQCHQDAQTSCQHSCQHTCSRVAMYPTMCVSDVAQKLIQGCIKFATSRKQLVPYTLQTWFGVQHSLVKPTVVLKG